MECFNHPSIQAVGICKTCGKALCRSCVIERDFIVACSEACAKDATEVHEMNQCGKKIYGIGVAQTKVPSGVIVWLLFAALFGGFSIFISIRDQEPDWFTLLSAVVFFFIAGLAYKRAKELNLQC